MKSKSKVKGKSIKKLGNQAEVKVVNEKTGAAKGVKLARFSLIPVKALWLLAEHFGRGASKYGERNFEDGYEWSKSFDALTRHLLAWWNGEDNDDHEADCSPDCVKHTCSPHLVAVAWHAFALLLFSDTHPEFDDRPKKG